MLDSTEIKNITFVYDQILKSETVAWSAIDDLLEMGEWLEDEELYKECDILCSYHSNIKVGSHYQDNPAADAFVKNMVEAVESIIKLYNQTNDLHPKNRYILSYYMALCQNGQIVGSL